MAVKGSNKKAHARLRRKIRIRNKIEGSNGRPRLSVFRSSKYTYAQLISDETGRTLASASSRDKEVLAQCQEMAAKAAEKAKEKEGAKPAPARAASTKSVLAAQAIGAVLAKRGLALDIKKVVFDRNGFLYHGRIKAVADGARKAGLEF